MTMLKQLAAAMQIQANDNDLTQPTRRQHVRRSQDRCVALIDGQMYPVENWSFGGALLGVDVATMAVNASLSMTLKFKVGNRVLDITHPARLLRKGHNRSAFQFEPLTRAVREAMMAVIDDANASDFAGSQLV